MWYFRSQIGVFWIAQHVSGKFELWFEEERLGEYPTSAAAADAVSKQTIGWKKWDSIPEVSAPVGINDWGRAFW